MSTIPARAPASPIWYSAGLIGPRSAPPAVKLSGRPCQGGLCQPAGRLRRGLPGPQPDLHLGARAAHPDCSRPVFGALEGLSRQVKCAPDHAPPGCRARPGTARRSARGRSTPAGMRRTGRATASPRSPCPRRRRAGQRPESASPADSGRRRALPERAQAHGWRAGAAGGSSRPRPTTTGRGSAPPAGWPARSRRPSATTRQPGLLPRRCHRRAAAPAPPGRAAPAPTARPPGHRSPRRLAAYTGCRAAVRARARRPPVRPADSPGQLGRHCGTAPHTRHLAALSPRLARARAADPPRVPGAAQDHARRFAPSPLPRPGCPRHPSTRVARRGRGHQRESAFAASPIGTVI